MKLQDYLKYKSIKIPEAAKQLKITRAYLYEIIGERKIPGRKLAQKILKWSEGNIRFEDLW